MIRKIFPVLALLALAIIFYNMVLIYSQPRELSKTAAYYAEKGPGDVGSANLVTAVVVTYRGLDTLGEVTILFLVASIIGFFLKSRDAGAVSGGGKASELLQTASGLVAPLVFMLGIYVFINGHLTPGGGFQGGAIIASGMMLLFLTDSSEKAGQKAVIVIESLSGFTYVLIGIAGLVLAGGFLDNRFLPLGKFGSLLSAGAIPLIYSLIGLKVGSELSAILFKLKDSREEA